MGGSLPNIPGTAGSRQGRKARAVIGAGVLLAALTVASAVLLVWNDRAAQLALWQRNVGSIATTVAAHADQSLRTADLVLLGVQGMTHQERPQAAADVPGLFGTPEMQAALQAKVSGIPQLDMAMIIDASGHVVSSSRELPASRVDVSERDYFRAGMKLPASGFYISAPFRGRIVGDWMFSLVRPIIGRNGEPVGVVVAVMSSQFFGGFYDRINAGDYSLIDLSRDDGTVLASDRANRASIGRSDLDASGRGSVVESRRVGGVPLIVTVGAPEPVVLATWRNTTRTMALMTFGLVTALVLLTLIVARLFERQDGTMRALRKTQREADEAARARTLLLEELQASEAALRDKSRVLELTLAHNDQGLLLVAPDGSVPICNRRAMELLELPDALMSGEPAFEEVVAYQRSIGEFPPGACSGGRLGLAVIPLERQIYERRRPNGTVLEIRTVPLPYGGMVRTFADITDRRRSEEQVRYLAQHDGLTRLVNRTVFRAALTDAIERAGYGQQRLAVHYLDLDGFKLVNDTYGHAAGDRLLVEVAARLRRAVREGDTVGRMGGDEFAVLQPLQAVDDAEHLAQRILSAVSEPYELGTLTCTIGLSIGVSIFPDHAANAETLMRGADVALYRAKANGRGLFCLFDEQMDRRQQHIFEVEQELKRALPRREFFLEYQPIVDAVTLAPVHFEALMRWRHPVWGVVSPGEFIEIAERSGTIVPLGLWALETACREAMRWPKEIGVSVNVSPVQFSRADLPAEVAAVLGRTGLSAGRLTLEVTEGVLLEETADVLEAMSSLRAMGVRFSLDDFGTAQSRLSYLRRFPFDVIKIDRSFVEDAVEQQASRAIVSAVLAIGRAFNLTVVAEGVERDGQLALLRDMGCGLVQGYLTGRPQARVDLPQIAYSDGH